jgi:ketosteroid isomerase-like protein
MKIPAYAVFLLAATALTQTPYPANSDALIRAQREKSNHAIATRDLKAFATTLADNLTVTTGRGTFLNHDTYIQGFATDFANPAGAITYTRTTDSIDLSAQLPSAAEHGHWRGALADGTIVYTGTYMSMWRYNAATGWRLRSELYVTLTCAPTIPCVATTP